MEELVNLISQKTGITKEQATTAVTVVTGFLKDKLPGGIGTQVESFINTGGTGAQGVVDGLKDKLGGMLGK